MYLYPYYYIYNANKMKYYLSIRPISNKNHKLIEVEFNSSVEAKNSAKDYLAQYIDGDTLKDKRLIFIPYKGGYSNLYIGDYICIVADENSFWK